MTSVPAPSQRYNKPAVLFHWAIFALVALAYLAIEIRGPKGSDSRLFWTAVHHTAGALALGLSLLRIVWRALSRMPDSLPQPGVTAFAAKLVHVALYAFIIAEPLLGILTVNFGGKPVTLAGLDWSFALAGPDPALRLLVKGLHQTIANVFYFVIGLHALAALWHQFIRRDGVLDRMRF